MIFLKITSIFWLAFLASCQATGWSYADIGSWCEACSGQKQSPINIETEKATDGVNVVFKDFSTFYENSDLTWGKENHTLYYRNNHFDAKVIIDDKTFLLFNIDLRWSSDQTGSEHSLDGVFFDSEIQCSFYNTKYNTIDEAKAANDGLAIVSLFLREDPSLEKDFAHNLKMVGLLAVLEAKNEPLTFNVKDKTRALRYMFSDDLTAYRYQGSLTHPPCTENVEWIVLKSPRHVTPAYMTALRKVQDIDGTLMQGNRRPLQELNERVVTKSVYPTPVAQ